MTKWDVFYRSKGIVEDYAKLDILREAVFFPIMICNWLECPCMSDRDKYILLGLIEHSLDESLTKPNPNDFDLSVAAPGQIKMSEEPLELFGGSLFSEKYRLIKKLEKSWKLDGFMATMVGSEDLHNPVKMHVLELFEMSVEIVNDMNQRTLLSILASEWAWDFE